MATIDDIFNSMPEVAAEGDHEYLVIDPVSRTISVPESERIFAVVGDEVADRKYFLCPRYVGDGLDLAGMFLTVYFRNAGGDEDGCLVKDLAVVGDYVTFSWLLSDKVAAYKGAIQFGVCADLPNTAEKKRPDWNTTMASGEVLEGLHPALGDVEGETSDVVTQLRVEITASTAAVEAAGAAQVDVVEAAGAAATAAAQEQIQAKGAATLATIPDDYTTLANKANEQANAIKGHLAGEIVQAGDVSPVEHYLGVKVHGKNLLPYPYTLATYTGNGGTFTAQDDGGVLCEGTPTDYVSLNLYAGAPLVKSGNLIFSASGDYKNVNISMVIYDLDNNVLLTKETWKGGPVISANLDDYPTAARWLVFIKRGTPNVEMAGTIYPQLELGTVATEYTPYIDPAGVTVTRCGKNLVDLSIFCNDFFVQNEDGSYTFTMGDQAGERFSKTAPVFWPAGVSYSLSADFIEHTVERETLYMILKHPDGTESYPGIVFADSARDLTPSKPVVAVQFYLQASEAAGAYIKFKNFQLELGAAATEYEPYNGATAMPAQDGTVNGLPSLAPSMTLLANTAGVTIDCIYNRDSNAVYAEILAKIAALSGAN